MAAKEGAKVIATDVNAEALKALEGIPGLFCSFSGCPKGGSIFQNLAKVGDNVALRKFTSEPN